MKIAVTYQDGNIFGHFGHTEQFKIYNVVDNIVESCEVVDTNGSGHGALAGFLQTRGVDTIICGGIGAGAVNALKDAGIVVLGGVSGSADEAVADYLAGRLTFNSHPTCSHHHDHGEGHSCGSHGRCHH